MPIEEKQTQDATPEDSPKSNAKAPLMPIILAVAVFVIGIGIFSVIMGVFSSPPANETETPPDSLNVAVAADTTAVDSAKEMSELEKLEQEIFGREDVIKADDIDQLAKKSKGSSGAAGELDPAEEIDLIKDEKTKLAKERAELDAWEKKLNAREKHLNEIIKKIEETESSRIGSLAKLYDGMKAKQVAPLINQLTDEQAVQILLNMKPGNAAKILGVMEPERAAHISENMITLNKEN